MTRSSSNPAWANRFEIPLAKTERKNTMQLRRKMFLCSAIQREFGHLGMATLLNRPLLREQRKGNGLRLTGFQGLRRWTIFTWFGVNANQIQLHCPRHSRSERATEGSRSLRR